MSDLEGALAEIVALRDQVGHLAAENEQLRRIIVEQDQHLSIHRHNARQRLLNLAAEHDRDREDRRKRDYPI